MDHCTFDLYDGTGFVNVHYWFDCPQDSRDAWSFNNGVYVRVVGRATSLDSFFQIKAYMVRTVKYFNDITHHFLYCIKAHIDISSQSVLQKKLDAITSASTVMPISHITPSQIPNECSLKEKIFSILRDPAYRSCLDYTVSLNESGILSLVNCSHGSLNTWLLQLVHGRLQWSCCSRLDLVHTFSTTVGPNIWQSAFGVDYGDVGLNDFQSVQIRSSSNNSSVVLLTFAFDHGMFVVDTVNCTVRGVRWLTEDGQMRQAFPLTERWPLTFCD
ncbi:hypothetical protein D1007_21486 [Hordeum vulgare]|nr:hypothetical protein D1007_21486 [Hordeum vulgare]